MGLVSTRARRGFPRTSIVRLSSGWAAPAGTYPSPMPRSSIGEWVPDVTTPPPSIGIPCLGTAFSSMTKGTSFCSGPRALFLRPRELLVERTAPPESRRDGVGFLRDVLPVQRKAHLEAKRVPRAESARNGAAVEHTVPQLRSVLCHHEQLAPVLPGVSGPVHHGLDSVDLALLESELLRLRKSEPLDRARPLNREQRVLVRDVADVGTGDFPLLEPLEIRLAVGRVDDQQKAMLAQTVGDQVIDDPAALVRQEGVLGLARADLLQVVGQGRLEELARAWPFHLELAHVRDVEDAAVSPHGPVLGADALVLNRHLPAGEGHHARSERDVPVVKRRPLQGLGHEPTMLTSLRKVPLRLSLRGVAAGATDRVVGPTGEDEPQEGIPSLPRGGNSKPRSRL